MFKHVSVSEAHDLLQQGAVYVDVRSQMEFDQGHAAGAINVPLLDRDPRSGQMMPNPDFVRVMHATFAPDTQLLIGCQVGGRSMRASQMLESFGFTDVSNVKGGYAGMRNPMGQSIDPGWADSGLPTETGAGTPGKTYEELLAKAD